SVSSSADKATHTVYNENGDEPNDIQETHANFPSLGEDNHTNNSITDEGAEKSHMKTFPSDILMPIQERNLESVRPKSKSGFVAKHNSSISLNKPYKDAITRGVS